MSLGAAWRVTLCIYDTQFVSKSIISLHTCSGLPKNLALGNELREKVKVKLTIEEIFSNVLRVTVCAERQEDTGADSLSVSIDVASLVSTDI